MIKIRFAANEDIPYIQSIAHETWTYTYGEIYTEEYIRDFISRAYSSENLRLSIERDSQSTKRSFLIAEYNEKPVGYAQTRQMHEEEFELLRIYVRPDFHKMGIGNDFIQEYKQILKPIHQLFAWVGKDNQVGRAFYEKRGFIPVTEKTETIQGQNKTQVKYVLHIS
ncbi:GNAT family N-acetyltransferase [Paenibacillus tundrae]|uniref:Ribosomal protein S18 acetylase RimI-like enzyme n=1 Tax=Paenibacillus tundrae TaxID=528187 RepID=A0ABT9WDY3_9BACL|nr:GNAT family N-acetyltransferase [Paenibacillus tundrae]MDQ0171449.1 ribosomal protein S18 acetylase RimI-like enzyme [Paenibacillus tundrae]